MDRERPGSHRCIESPDPHVWPLGAAPSGYVGRALTTLPASRTGIWPTVAIGGDTQTSCGRPHISTDGHAPTPWTEGVTLSCGFGRLEIRFAAETNWRRQHIAGCGPQRSSVEPGTVSEQRASTTKDRPRLLGDGPQEWEEPPP